jgi:hypothetical protein
MSALSDAVGALREVLKLTDDVKRAGEALKEISQELREHDRRILAWKPDGKRPCNCRADGKLHCRNKNQNESQNENNSLAPPFEARSSLEPSASDADSGFKLTISAEAFEFPQTLGARPMRKTVEKFIGDVVFGPLLGVNFFPSLQALVSRSRQILQRLFAQGCRHVPRGLRGAWVVAQQAFAKLLGIIWPRVARSRPAHTRRGRWGQSGSRLRLHQARRYPGESWDVERLAQP